MKESILSLSVKENNLCIELELISTSEFYIYIQVKIYSISILCKKSSYFTLILEVYTYVKKSYRFVVFNNLLFEHGAIISSVTN